MPRRKPRGRPFDGWLVIDKPPGLTSTDVVNRKLKHGKQTGHPLYQVTPRGPKRK